MVCGLRQYNIYYVLVGVACVEAGMQEELERAIR
jgi:hypothetical protein